MGSLVSYMFTSLDGYIADDEGQLDWVPIDHELMAFANDFFAERGRDRIRAPSYEGFVEYWDHLGPTDPATTEDEARFAETFGATPAACRHSRARGCRAAHHPDPRRRGGQRCRLKADASADLALVSGPDLRSHLAAAGVIDRLLVLLVPVVLGSGVRHFAGEMAELRLRLRDSHRFSGGVTLLDYEGPPRRTLTPAGGRS